MGLEVSNVTVSFGGNVALDAVSLDATDGHITALIGPNGAGKTTLFNVITGVQRPRAGTVMLNGSSIDRVAPHRRARLGMARTFQRLEAFGSISVRDNIRVAACSQPRRHRSTVVDEIVDRLNLGAVADRQADTLSTGTGRVLELGRCLASSPTVLLLDEPASGQDEDETNAFSGHLAQLAADGMAILLVEHDMDLVMKISDRIHVLDFGHLLASGTPTEIRRSPAVQAAYLGEMASR